MIKFGFKPIGYCLACRTVDQAKKSSHIIPFVCKINYNRKWSKGNNYNMANSIKIR